MAAGSAAQAGENHGHDAGHSSTTIDRTSDSDGSDSMFDFDDLDFMDPSIPAIWLLQRSGHIDDLSIPTAAEEPDSEVDPQDDPDFKGLVDSSSQDEDAASRPRDIEAACR